MTTPDQSYTTTPAVSDNNISAQDVLDFLHDVRRLVDFQQSIGIEGYPRTPELTRFIAGPPPAAAAAPRQPAIPARVKASPTPSAPAPPQPQAAESDTSLITLYTEAAACQRCPRHLNRKKVPTTAATTGVKLLIITDTPSIEDNQSGVPMSGEPGLLLDKMLAAIGLDRTMVHLSLLSKCYAEAAPKKNEIEACLPFLLTEISLVRPKVICTMGVLAAQNLLHTSKPLSQLRGKFHEFQGLPLMATFSPEFLLKNPEMKKATWLDLQMIQKKCDEK